MASAKKKVQEGVRAPTRVHRSHPGRSNRSGLRLATFLGLVFITTATIALCIHWVWRPWTLTPIVVLPEHMAQLEPELIELIERHAVAVRESPRDARRHATLGLVYEANTLWSEALACFTTATRLDPDQPIWAHHAAKAAQQFGDTPGALDRLRAAADRFPNFAPIHYRLGDLLLERGDLEAAAKALQQTCQLQPDAPETYTRLADVRLRMGRYAEAATLLERAVKLDDTFETARHLLGRAYRALGRDSEAQVELRLAQSCKERQLETFRKRHLQDDWEVLLPKYVRTLSLRLRRARTLIDTGRPRDAIIELEPLAAGHPDNTRVLDKLGIAYMQVGRIDEAHRVLLRAKQINDGVQSVSLNLAACWLLGNKPEDALKEIDHAIELAPGKWKAHYTRGLALMELGRNPEARDALLAAITRRSTDPRVYTKLAAVCMATDRLIEARDHLEVAVRNWPKFAPASLGLAEVSIRLEDWDRASDALATARRLAPNDPRVIALSAQIPARVVPQLAVRVAP